MQCACTHSQTGWAVHSGRRHFIHALAHHWQRTFFPYVCVCASTYFILFCIRTVAQAVSLLLFHHYHRLLFLFFSFFFRYLVCLSIHLVHVIFHISRCLNSVNRVDVDCKAIPMFHFVRALLTDLLTVSRLMRWAFHVTWTALRHALLHQKSSPNSAIARQTISIFYSLLPVLLMFFFAFCCVYFEWGKCVCKHARERSRCALFFALFTSNYKSHATKQNPPTTEMSGKSDDENCE